MLIKEKVGKFHVVSIVIMLILLVLPIEGFAKVKPWDPYVPYIPNETPVAKRHLRGTWISTVVNLDWPLVETRNIVDDAKRIQKSKEEIIAILDRAVKVNLNAVFFQVSPEGDAFYKSDIVPWSRYLTGTFGKDPGFDPLAFAIEQAHKRNLEIHAWFNPYRISVNTNNDTIASLNIEKSVFKQHPDWIRTARNRFVLDPGIPQARQWVIERVMEVLQKYDVDGIHFDDYFYYERYEGELKDQDTFEKYNNGEFSNIGDWRRNNTYLLVSELSDNIRSEKPWVKFGISPAGVWGNQKDGHLGGSQTSASFTNYDSCFADTKKWVEEELIDYVAPQVYFSFGNPRAPYGEVASWWSEICKGKDVHLYLGHALYKVNDDADQYFMGNNAVPEFVRQLKFNIVKPEIMGSIMFRVRNFNDLGKQQVVDAMKHDLWSTKALVPVMPWKGGQAPNTPTLGKIDAVDATLKLSWADNDSNTAYYAIYRMNMGEKIEITPDASAKKLVGTVRKKHNEIQQFIDPAIKGSDKYVYAVTALDRLHNESEALIITKSQSNAFHDIGKEYTWAVSAIDALHEIEIVKGYGNGIFNPGHNTKRGDFILMVIRALNLEVAFDDNFSDVENNTYYYKSIGIAKALGIAKGSEGAFYPQENITRQDMIVIIDRAIKVTGIEFEKADETYLNEYNDTKLISDYAREAIATLTKAGLIEGSAGRVNPKYTATRAEIAVVLHRLLNNIIIYANASHYMA